MSEPSLPDKIAAIHARLDAEKIAHAFGGALALAYYAEPRATIDIDLNVFVPPDAHRRIHDALAPLGVDDGDLDPLALERDGQCRVRWGSTPIDLFYAYDELHEAMRRAARRVAFGEGELTILAPEHLVVCKAIFDRPKDWIDIEQVLVCGEELDVAEIDRWLKRVTDPDDPRKQRFDALLAAG
jgi:hypothetical protein